MKKYILSIILALLLIPSLAFSWGDSPVGPWGYGVTIGAYGYQPAKVMLGLL